ncbi:MAG: hypothetical protein M1161_00180 [Candidatus Thermoplasmatota archaeon]|jgi:hypothetical protein|nr:hypothetical protein [Candidatus Thermoplasmatota archaeon]
MPDGERIDPKLAETGFYKTVHDYIQGAMAQYFYFFSSILTFDSWGYKAAVSSLNTLYNAIIIPHNTNNPEDKEVRDFQEEWKKLNEKYWEGFELHPRPTNDSSIEDHLRSEYSERYTLIMTYLNTLGLTQMKQRGEAWEDAELDVMMKELE